jgi:23S rRNA pseudouridine2605 synthase
VVTKKRQTVSQISLCRALSKLGIVSRSQARLAISAGRVTVNGRTVRDADAWLDPRSDRIALDGKTVRPTVKRYAMMNKPTGLVTTRSDERGRNTVYALLPPEYAGCFPVGRLDKDTGGLLLFTNDTRFGETITNPERKIHKSYVARVDHTLTSRDAEIMEQGMSLADGTRLMPAMVVRHGDRSVCTISITEGKNRQVRRMLETLGFKVLSLVRVRIGSLELGDLAPGQFRAVTAKELLMLKESIQ